MSSSTAAGPLHGLGHAQAASQWKWFVALGVALIGTGALALGDVVLTSLVSVILIGAAMVVGGMFQVVHAFATRKRWASFLFGLLSGVLYVVGGLFVMREPVQGSVVITLFVLLALIAGGVMRIIVALRHREMPGWWLMLIGGLVSVVAGIVLYRALPWSGLWVLGTLIGFELVVHGLSWLQFGWALRKLRA